MSHQTAGYQLLDSGHGRKLEQVGPYLLDRQAPQAHWSPKLPRAAWREAIGMHHRSERGGGSWEWRTKTPDSWQIDIYGLKVLIKPTPFGHLGLFFEHATQWQWMSKAVTRALETRSEPPRILNLFAYTGLATLALAKAGAEVCHVDAAKGVVDWGRENARASGLQEASIRWIVDDVLSFAQRELRRGRSYHGIVLDPPTYGRGSKREIWKIEEHLPGLLTQCAKLLDPKAPLFFILSCHTPGHSPIVLENLAREALEATEPDLACTGGEMTIGEADTGRLLPSGTFVRLTPN